MARLLLVLVILLALVLALFGIQNPQPVTLNFLNFRSDALPLYVVILLSALVGILLSTILGLRSRIAATLRLRRQERQITELEKQLAARTTTVAPTTEMPADTTTVSPSQVS